MTGDVLTTAQRLELKEIAQAAMAEMIKSNSRYIPSVVGASSSRQAWDVLNALFDRLTKANEKMPEQFTLDISSDIPAAVDALATAYLATDLLRPRPSWSFSAKKRALGRELQDVMDRRAWFSVLCLRRARTYLGR